MPLQNRVDPFSRIHAVSDRGAFMGNRGVLHRGQGPNLQKQSWGCDLWIICALSFKDKALPLMEDGFNTQLFFLDEATALAAGHRPCFYCRRDAATGFAHAAGGGTGLSASELNAAIGTEMKPHLRVHDPVPRPLCQPADLPDGAMFGVNGQAFLKLGTYGRAWSFSGYGPLGMLPASAQKLTPDPTITALRNGYRAQIHASAIA